MLLDIGNTNISLLYNSTIHSIPTNSLLDTPKIFLQKFPTKKIIFTSVVPDASLILAQEAKKCNTSIQEILIDDIPLKIDIDNPKELGIDRAINAYSALQKFGSNTIVVDFGTALTFDIIYKGIYRGGMIYPGLAMATHNLHLKTAKLPDVKIHQFNTGIGKNTVDAISCGVCVGYTGVLKETLAYIKNYYNEKFIIIFTGGSGKIFYQVIEGALFEENLILDFLQSL